MIRVTALVSTYNGARWLPSRLDNLLAQTVATELQIVVVDSGSEQNEASIVESYQRLHSQVDYLRTPRETLYAAWNRGIVVAQGSYLTSANVDDRLCPDALERLIEALEADPRRALVYADNWETSDEGELLHWDGSPGSHRRVRRASYSHPRLLLNCICGPQPMWRRELHRQFGLFNPDYQVCGDWEFWLRVAEKASMFHLDQPLGLYFSNPNGLEQGNFETALREAKEIRRRFFRAPAAP